MSIEQAVVEALRNMPPDAQRQVLNYAEAVRRASRASARPLNNPRGIWADLPLSISEEDIASARREMWDGFPREIDL